MPPPPPTARLREAKIKVKNKGSTRRRFRPKTNGHCFVALNVVDSDEISTFKNSHCCGNWSKFNICDVFWLQGESFPCYIDLAILCLICR